MNPPGSAAGGAQPAPLVAVLSPARRVALLLLNALPLAHAASVVAVVAFPWATPGARAAAALGVLYLLPPLLGGLLFRWAKPAEGRVRVGSRDYFLWWALLNLQVIFGRLAFLEELLRLVPGLYSGWLRLWGARIGRLTYWGAGTTILDRSFLDVGDDVVFGAGVRIAPHLHARNRHGEPVLLLGTVRIGDRAEIGGYSLLAAGARIADDEVTGACLIAPPFSRLRGGRRRGGEPAREAGAAPSPGDRRGSGGAEAPGGVAAQGAVGEPVGDAERGP